jgi:hypothetical protein
MEHLFFKIVHCAAGKELKVLKPLSLTPYNITLWKGSLAPLPSP